MDNPQWMTERQFLAAFLNFMGAHFPTMEELAEGWGRSDRTLRTLRQEENILWTKLLFQREGVLPPEPWVLDLLGFMRNVQRTGQSIPLPAELLLKWGRAHPQLRHLFPPPPEPPGPSASAPAPGGLWRPSA